MSRPADDATHHPSALLRVTGVSKVYGEGHTAVTAVSDATMAVDEGEFVALLGPSGSGKTTLISIIGGLLSPSTGSVMLGSTDVTQMSRKQLTAFRAEKVGFVFQSANLVPFLTARENLLYVSSPGQGHLQEAGAGARRPAARGARPGRARRRTCRSSCPAASASAWRSAAPS